MYRGNNKLMWNEMHSFQALVGKRERIDFAATVTKYDRRWKVR